MADKDKKEDKAEPETAEAMTAAVQDEEGTAEIVKTKKGEVGRGGLRTTDPAFADGAMEVESYSNMPRKDDGKK
jgi:hypothetical protein